jgi:hypothetical protein
MRKICGKKLELHRETLRTLEGKALLHAAAAGSVATNCQGSVCTTCTIGTDCPNTSCLC